MLLPAPREFRPRMCTRHLLLDFEGHRLRGVRPFALLQAKDGAWTWRISNVEAGTRNAERKTEGAEFPFRDEFRNGRGDVLYETQRALAWAHEHIGTGGAAIGFLAYDLARQIEPRAFNGHSPPDDVGVPDLRLVFCEELREEAAHGEPETGDSLPHPDTPNASPGAHSNPETPNPKPDYEAAIARILQFIAAGDIYQANLTRRFTEPLPCSPAALYERLRAVHPMPFSALLEWDDLAIVSNSPERFLRLQKGVLTAQPIKGTMRRGANEQEDERLRNELQHSVKDRAENVMIVDLLRNDLGRVCEYGSMLVPQLFGVETFPTLHHLVSTVTGKLRPGLDGVDALRAAFPCGSITGAPKIRAMQIIDELEPVRRGAAMGAIGYFGFNGDMDWNVAIRTVTCKNGTAYFHAGGGIVADSRADSEHAELMLKASAIQHALSRKDGCSEHEH